LTCLQAQRHERLTPANGRMRKKRGESRKVPCSGRGEEEVVVTLVGGSREVRRLREGETCDQPQGKGNSSRGETCRKSKRQGKVGKKEPFL